MGRGKGRVHVGHGYEGYEGYESYEGYEGYESRPQNRISSGGQKAARARPSIDLSRSTAKHRYAVARCALVQGQAGIHRKREGSGGKVSRMGRFITVIYLPLYVRAIQ